MAKINNKDMTATYNAIFGKKAELRAQVRAPDKVKECCKSCIHCNRIKRYRTDPEIAICERNHRNEPQVANICRCPHYSYEQRERYIEKI